MSKVNYVIREDGMPLMISGESEFDFIETADALKNYPYIIESMNNEEYYLENDICFIFDELIYENKVVGFATFELYDQSVLMLTECYILPEFRGKQIFFNEISKMIFSAPQFGILQPTRDIVELLIRYSYAKNVTDDIVASGIDFYFNEWDAKSNKRDEISADILLSNFYDLKICSSIIAYDDEIIYHDLLENDLRKYGERKELSEDYFKDLSKLFFKNNDEFEKLISELKEELPQEELGFDEIIGEGEGLSELMQGIVDNEIISYDRALEIKQQLLQEYECGEITDEDMDKRLTELILDNVNGLGLFEDFQDTLDLIETNDEDSEAIKGFFELIGDNEELSENIFKAMLLDDENEFENLIINEMKNNEEFFNKFVGLVESYDENELQSPEEEYLDLGSVGLNLDSPYPIAEMMWGPNDNGYKLDDTYYGKDYPISHDIYMFRVLKSLKKHKNLKIALATAGMKGSMTSQSVESLLFMQDFISDEVNYDNWDEFAHDSLNVNDLKNILRENNLKISGKKQELIDRIAENQIPLDEFRSEKVTLTENGDEFLQENKWIDFYDTFLNKFDFNDFVKYLDNNEGEFIELSLKYLEQHLKLAKKEDNDIYLADCIMAHDIISKAGREFFKS
ncbi:SAP domain-containing protein [Methanobrevibacter sp.]